MQDQYLNIQTERGKWYVSNHARSAMGVGQSGVTNHRQCIVSGPFPTQQDASGWLQGNPAHGGPLAFIWQEIIG